MPDDDKPSPIEDLRKGLGLLFRAAKTTLEKLPTGELEEAVMTSAKEVGRAIENVTQTVEKQIFRRPGVSTPHETTPDEAKAEGKNAEEKKGPGEPPPDVPV
jgi:hypothetical protein